MKNNLSTEKVNTCNTSKHVSGKVKVLAYEGPSDEQIKDGELRFKNKKRLKHKMENEIHVVNPKGTNIARFSGGRAVAAAYYSKLVKELNKESRNLLKHYIKTGEMDKSKLLGMIVYFNVASLKDLQSNEKNIVNKAINDFAKLCKLGSIRV